MLIGYKKLATSLTQDGLLYPYPPQCIATLSAYVLHNTLFCRIVKLKGSILE